MFVAASSTAWTRSSRQTGGAPPAMATSRTSARISASRSRAAGTVIAAKSRHPGVVRGGALDEPAGALATRELAVANDDRAARQDDLGRALDLATLVARVVDVHVVGLRRDRVPAGRVVDDDVGVGADGDGALARVHPEQLRRGGGGDLDPAFAADATADDAAVVEQVEPVLDAREAVGDLAEVAPPELLLAVEVERA